MSDLRAAAQQALEALAGYRRELNEQQPCDAEVALRAALAQAEPVQEPVGAVLVNRESREGVMFYSVDMIPDPSTLKNHFELVKVYTSPPQHKPLTEDEIIAVRTATNVSGFAPWSDSIAFARALETAHGIKGGGNG